MQSESPISRERLPRLRLAFRTSRLSFPAQVPTFSRQHRPDVQWRIVALYFVQGWSCLQLAQRFGVTRGRIWQVIRSWVDRAATLGYLQWIPPEGPVAIDVESLASASASHTGGFSRMPLHAMNTALVAAQSSVDSVHKNP